LPERGRFGVFRVGATSLFLGLLFELPDPLLSQGAFPLGERRLHLAGRAVGLSARRQLLRLREVGACGMPIVLSVARSSPDQQHQRGDQEEDHHDDHDHNGAHDSPSWAAR
jgi:hypothetical protein